MTPGESDPLAIPPAVPCEVTDEELAEKYSSPNPFAGPDPKGDAEVVLPNGLVTTAASRSRRRAKLAAAWEHGRANWQQRRAASA
jgi:hypothetical protein